jgi:hypothetical protein
MRFYTRTHKHCCGVDLHARSMYVCAVNQAGEVLLHKNLLCDPALFLAVIGPYREDLVVGVEYASSCSDPFPGSARSSH